MVLNAFIEAQASLELSLKLLESVEAVNTPPFRKARAEALHELGRVFRYQGSYVDSERSLLNSLKISHGLNRKDGAVRQGVADTLHELGVLEVKKHSLDSAASFLQQSLDMRRSSDNNRSDAINAACAATLHQLAAIHVARKPPSLEKAKTLLQEALGLCRQIGQRAATLKQLARVTIRQGFLDRAETYLEQALELYLELYGDNKLHINIAAVKFQQGAIALQREQLDHAWLNFSECLRIRRHVYAYARPVGSTSKDKNPTHLEVSCVLHELGGVAFAQGRFSQSMEMLQSERIILERLEEATTQTERLYQARLTNLTWLRKCAKEIGDEDEATRFSNERTAMKKKAVQKLKENLNLHSDSVTLQHKAIRCRLLARSFSLEKNDDKVSDREELLTSLDELLEEISVAPPESMKRAAMQFRYTVLLWIDKPIKERRSPILKACDKLRQVIDLQSRPYLFFFC
jgi:tetratricopeptide (TPR) repeat protein